MADQKKQHLVLPVVLAAEPDGRALLFKAWKSKDQADKLLAYAQSLETKQYPFAVYGRPLTQVRKNWACGDKGVKHGFGGVEVPVVDWCQPFKEVRDQLVEQFDLCDVWFNRDTGAYEKRPTLNFCLVNDYPDGSYSIASHRDGDLYAKNKSVFTLGLGASRTMQLTCDKPGVPGVAFQFDHGDLFLMDGNIQKNWKHGIPVEPDKGQRISLTYRGVRV